MGKMIFCQTLLCLYKPYGTFLYYTKEMYYSENYKTFNSL